jgi:hypothetical protein
MVKNEKEEGNMTRSMPLTRGKLSYPTRPLQVQGGTVEEYIIPDETKGEILERLYPFRPIPSLDEELYDLHKEKRFRVRDFRVTRESGHNFLVSPYYPRSGGSVIDWMPVDEVSGEQPPKAQY